MSQGPTAADVYPASTVLLAADLATVTTQTCHVLTYIYHSKGNRHFITNALSQRQ